ncbi:transposase [Nitratireductor aquimarinus]|nr:transposase [Nitratireductor aquimarinus]MBY6000777.1 IS110 family transposase [Tritonibacter mobilis]MBY6022808.1 IS110 family transposase [Nitratireductor sp. DP7N14-4]
MLATLLGELPELGMLNRRRIASLAGLSLHARESGTWKGDRRIWNGRRQVRKLSISQPSQQTLRFLFSPIRLIGSG